MTVGGSKMKKILFVVTALLVFISCAGKGESSPIDPENFEVIGEVINGIRIIDVEAYKFGFEPEYIVVNSGETVKLNLKTRDVSHGFMVEKLDINVSIDPGEIKTVDLIAEKKGVYQFWCSVPCGSGHRSMEGFLIIK